jgi:hypothetical protein
MWVVLKSASPFLTVEKHLTCNRRCEMVIMSVRPLCHSGDNECATALSQW